MKQKKSRALWLAIMAICILLGGVGSGLGAMQEIHAEEKQENSIQMLYVNTNTSLYERASESTKVLAELPTGSVVIYLEGNAEWAKIRQGELSGYVKASALQVESPNQELHDEMAYLEEYNTEFINEIERLKAEKRRSRIFGAVIIVLIVAIFGVGVFSTLRKKKQGAAEEDEETEDAEEKDTLEYLDVDNK